MKKVSKLSKVLATGVALSTVTVGSVSAADAPPVNDLNQASNWAQGAIQSIENDGIMVGDGQHDFRPMDNISRAEIAVVLAKTLNLDTTHAPSQPTFSDVSASNWAYKYVEAVHKAGLMNGDGDGQFGPSRSISREEMAVVFSKAVKADVSGKGKTLNIADKDSIDSWARDYVAAALDLGLMHGENGKFAPRSLATRQEVAVVDVNFITVEHNKTSNSDPTTSL